MYLLVVSLGAKVSFKAIASWNELQILFRTMNVITIY